VSITSRLCSVTCARTPSASGEPAQRTGGGHDRRRNTRRHPRGLPGLLRRRLPELAELLPQIETPVTIVNGRHDRVVPLANAEFLDARLPNSRVVIIEGGHFIWEEAPAEYAAAILDAIGVTRT
jgi:pimeloyl-ACP methyl ester carboxylesterase